MIGLADGGFKKTKENSFLFLFLSNIHQIIFDINYYAPHHGHSEVDGHFGQAKIWLHRHQGLGPVISEDQVFASFAHLPPEMKWSASSLEMSHTKSSLSKNKSENIFNGSSLQMEPAGAEKCQGRGTGQIKTWSGRSLETRHKGK